MISVIIPTYNRANKLKDSILSVLNQSYEDIEVLIIDDCSSDDTEEVVNSLSQKDKRLKYFKLNKRSGACVARNVGIEKSIGEYISFHDSDDICWKEKLEIQLSALLENDADIVFCQMRGISVSDNNTIIGSQFSEGFLPQDADFLGISTQTLFGKRSVFENYKFNPEIPRLQDFELLIRITDKYRLYCVAKPLVDYYIQSDSISKKNSYLYHTCLLIKKLYPDFRNKRKNIALHLANMLIYKSFQLTDAEKIYRKKMCFLSLYYNSSMKMVIKVILAFLKILPVKK